MSKPAIGAEIQFCSHDGTFIADIFEIGDVNVVVANGRVNGDNLNRPATSATHHLSDFPHPGCWKPDRGFFVVPSAQVVETEAYLDKLAEQKAAEKKRKQIIKGGRQCAKRLRLS